MNGRFDWVLARKALMLTVTLATLGGTVYLYMLVPKGFFPQEAPDSEIRRGRRLPPILVRGDEGAQQALVDVLKSDLPSIISIQPSAPAAPIRPRITAVCSSR